MQKHQIVLLLGSNLGNRFRYLEQAKKGISNQIGNISLVSKLYESEAWGNTNQQHFLNQVVIATTALSPIECLHQIHTIEQASNRIRKEIWGERTLDIDILFYDNEMVNSQRLTIPHPYLTDRKFTLLPLVEIMPHFIHPVLNKKLSDLLDICTDQGKVWEYTNEL